MFMDDKENVNVMCGYLFWKVVKSARRVDESL